jgi:hypothetical protein
MGVIESRELRDIMSPIGYLGLLHFEDNPKTLSQAGIWSRFQP